MISDSFWRIIRTGSVGLILAAAVAGLVLGDAWLWVAVEWSPPAYVEFYAPDGFDTLTTVALLVAALVKAALLWLILRAPAPGPLDRRAKALRRLLYLAVAYTLVLWYPIAMLPDAVDAAFQLALWTAIYVLYLLVIRWRSRMLRAAAGAMFAVGLAGMASELLDELDLPELGSGDIVELGLMLAGVAATIITIVGQRRDGRWSRGTQVAGWLSVGVYALVIPLNIFFGISSGSLAMLVMMDAVGLIGLVWIAATARELPTEDRSADPPPARRRVIRVAVAAVAVLPIIALIHPEQTPHLTYTGWSMDCYDRPSFGDLKPAERDAAFLCRARSTDGGVPPMFPDSLSDQQILASGRALCRTKDRDEQEAILTRAGSARSAWGADPWDLVYVCPEIVGATHPELLRSAAETKAANTAYIAEKNAKCRDPWPRTKGVVQATANYFLFADGDHGYLVHDPEDEVTDEASEQAIDKMYDDGTLIGVTRTSALIGHVEDVIDLCLTVKAFRTAPPQRTAGWQQVNEVPIVSRSGRLTVPEMGGGEVGAGAPMPNLAIAGKGRYRLRVYVRVGDAGEEHLVVVFPGASRKRFTLKP
ncbi:DMT family transporter [Streptosporangium subroseum]|uniref:DMT family transporter n=1 Tax=Streptosporangium subroseum TaxID=106412 RepID=UPI0011812119|nr:DMT family transporter [Streptosporangium subroseum]